MHRHSSCPSTQKVRLGWAAHECNKTLTSTRTEDPYKAAERFLNKHELPLSYVSQVVAFIEKNTVGMSLGQATYSDPYTGGARYQASSSSNSGATYRDPFTGGARRRPPGHRTVTLSSSHPLAGGDAYSSAPALSASRKVSQDVIRLLRTLIVTMVVDPPAQVASAIQADQGQRSTRQDQGAQPDDPRGFGRWSLSALGILSPS